MSTIQHMFRHPAGKVGITLGLAIGFFSAVMGETSKALLFIGLCRFLASRIRK